MKKLILLFACMLSFLSLQATDITVISTSFKNGNVTVLVEHMDTEVNITLPGTSKKGAGDEVVAILSKFFEINKPASFSIAHHADKAESGFLVGKLVTDKGEFRVNIAYIAKEDKMVIQTIRIE